MTGPEATRWVGGRLAAGLSVSLVCVAAVFGLAVPNLAGAFEIVGFGAAVSFDGSSSRQAGAHADLRFRLGFPLDPESQQLEANPRDLRVDLPPGFSADPPAVPTCSFEQLSAPSDAAGCPRDSQIGVATIEVAPGERTPARLFNLERPLDSAGLFGFNYAGGLVIIQAQVRPGDYGISALSARTSQAIPVVGVEIELWGEPSDPSHDAARGGASDLGPTAFLTNATSCPGDAVVFAAEADSWQQPGLFSRASVNSDFDGAPFSLEGCELLAFSPAFAAKSGSRRAAAPTGFQLDLALPGGEVPGGLAGARTRNLTVTLPPGFAISIPGAALVGTCSPAQVGLGSNDPPRCPLSSRIGTVRIDSPLVDRPLEGGVVLARPYDNPFGSLLALYILAEGPGFYLKLPGRGQLDPSNGQLTISFSDLPQLPFSDLRLDLFGGPEALLAAPSACGEYRTDAEISSWSSNARLLRSSTTTISEGCAGGEFQPELYGGSTNPVAGRASPFILRLTRSDSDQNIARFRATLPPGVSASLAGVPHCPEPAAASDCPAASRVGTAIVGLGAGEPPAYLPEAGKPPGAIYLAGPYRGAPFSLLISVPGQVGSFGLGAVVVRATVDLDPRTAQIEIDSGPLPQILRGVPLNYRDIRLEIDRPGLIRNPTSCEPLTIAATATSALGRLAPLSHRFQIRGCGALPFKPGLALHPSGALGRNGHPALRAVLRAGTGEAGIADAAFALPPGELLDTDHIRALCARRLPPDRCPHASRLGFARVWTPALAQPLRGPIYLRVPADRYPEMLVDLRGDDQLSLVLHGRTEAASGGRLRVRFSGLPDLPFSKAILTLAGGRRGIFVNSEALCARPRRATVSLSTHSGKRRLLRPELDLRGSC